LQVDVRGNSANVPSASGLPPPVQWNSEHSLHSRLENAIAVSSANDVVVLTTIGTSVISLMEGRGFSGGVKANKKGRGGGRGISTMNKTGILTAGAVKFCAKREDNSEIESGWFVL